VTTDEATTTRIRQRIRAAGKRATPGRIAVIQRLLEVARPMTHADLADLLEPEGFDRASLFRNLIDLTEAGLISRTDLGDHVWRFYLGDGGRDVHHHPHFVCVACGRTLCLDGVEVSIKAGPQAPRSLRRHEAEINIRGRCDDCYEGEISDRAAGRS
jgi:Fur family ferric uptake transcriptional regulator